MTPQEFGTFLRQRREEKSVTLADISAFTRINQNFLEAIENGQLSLLPQTYVRAFLREFAASVDLNPEEIMKMYDETLGVQPSVSQSKASAGSSEKTEPLRVPSSDPLTPLVRALRPFVYGGIIVIVAGAAYFLVKNESPATRTTPSEIPFDRVIRETEAALPVDTIETYMPARSAINAPLHQTGDSLILEMSTSDSVWLTIRIDHTLNEEYLFSPNRRRVWKAESTFVITMGNAGGATFRLNGMELGALGRPGAVIRNRVLSSALLQ